MEFYVLTISAFEIDICNVCLFQIKYNVPTKTKVAQHLGEVGPHAAGRRCRHAGNQGAPGQSVRSGTSVLNSRSGF